MNEKKNVSEAPTRKLWEIAEEIKLSWANMYFGAVPYVDAMKTLSDMSDNYYDDDAHTIVIYFLGNATYWRGETARRIKKELRALAKLD
jgi:hypothetical protein